MAWSNGSLVLEPFRGYTPATSPYTAPASPTRLLSHAHHEEDPSIPCLPQLWLPKPLHPRLSTAHQSARPRPPVQLCQATQAGTARATSFTPSRLVLTTPTRHLDHAHQPISGGVRARPLPLSSPSCWPLSPHPRSTASAGANQSCALAGLQLRLASL